MREGIDEGSTRGTARSSAGQGAGTDERGPARTSGTDGEPPVLSVRGTRLTGTPDATSSQDASPEPVLVLTSASGQVFHLPVDGSLRAAVRTASAPSQPASDAAGARLRPKDIQARIRGGESAAEVAESAEVSLDAVERYAGPVLAERAHVAALARATVVRTARSRPSLEDLVRHRLASRGVALTAVTWDAWRRGEAGWVLQVGFRAGTRDRVARWSFDPVAENVDPLDDEARWLSSSHEAESSPRGRRLSAVRVFDVEADGGLDPDLSQDTGPLPPLPSPDLPELPGDVSGTSETDDAAAPDHDAVAARTMDLLDALSDRRGRRQPMADLETDEMDGLDDDDAFMDEITDAPGGPSGTGGEDGGLGPGYGSGFPAHVGGVPGGGAGGARTGRSGSHLRAVFAAGPADDSVVDDDEDDEGLDRAQDREAGSQEASLERDDEPVDETVDAGHDAAGAGTSPGSGPQAPDGGSPETGTPSSPLEWWQQRSAREPSPGAGAPPEADEPLDLTDGGAHHGAGDAEDRGTDDEGPDGAAPPAAPRTVGPSWAALASVPEAGSIGTWVGPSTPTALPDASSPLSLSTGRVPRASTVTATPPAEAAEEDQADGSATGDDPEPGTEAGGRKGASAAAPGRAGSSRGRAGRRSSVPSWDEIVFGSASEPSADRED